MFPYLRHITEEVKLITDRHRLISDLNIPKHLNHNSKRKNQKQGKVRLNLIFVEVEASKSYFDHFLLQATSLLSKWTRRSLSCCHKSRRTSGSTWWSSVPSTTTTSPSSVTESIGKTKVSRGSQIMTSRIFSYSLTTTYWQGWIGLISSWNNFLLKAWGTKKPLINLLDFEITFSGIAKFFKSDFGTLF